MFSFALVLAMPHPARWGRRKEPVDLVELLSSRNGESHRIMLEDSECKIVLRHEDVDRHSQEILDRYRIPADRSPDLMAMKPSPEVDRPASVTAEATTDEPPATPTSAAPQ